MRNVTIGLIQLQNEPGRTKEDYASAEKMVREAAGMGARIICLPELFVTGYNLDIFGEDLYGMAEGLTGPTITGMRALAKELGVYIIAPIAMQMRTSRPLENNAVLIGDDGEVVGVYSKNHLFGDEPKYFSTDGRYPVFDTKYGKIGIMICCDNNFPEPARILALSGAEIIFLPAAWRVQEEDLWKLLISSHACENNVFIAAANTYSKMDGLFLFGHSRVVDPRGRVICESVAEGRDIIVETLDLDDVYSMRAVMPSLKDRHPETYGKFLEPVKE
jgi:predicted amidohydrolase